MSQGTPASDARDIVEAVTKELEAAQAGTEAEAVATAEAKVEAKSAEQQTQTEKPAEAEAEKPKAEKVERKSQFVPVSKANAWRHEAQEAKAEAETLRARVAELEKSKAPTEPDLKAIAKEIAGEDASPEVVERLLSKVKDLIPKGSSEDLEAIRAAKAEIDAKRVEAEENAKWNSELGETLKTYPELKGHEESLKELAYAEGNEKVPLKLLALQYREDMNLKDAPPSAEGKSKQVSAEAAPDYANMTETDLAKLDGPGMDKFLEWQRGKVTAAGRRF